MTNLGSACFVALMNVVISYSEHHGYATHMHARFPDVYK